MTQTLETFFLPAGAARSGQRLCLFHPACGTLRGAVVYVHPFAEELNKARRMATVQARALADAGFAVLQIDLLGCGDSSGDFGDATWDEWVADVVLAARWMRHRCDAPLWLWGLRAGALLAAGAARQMDEPINFLFWQPAVAGRPLMQQFLRLKAAASMTDGGAKAAMDKLHSRLAAGQPVHVAGYRISPDLARGFEDATLSPPKRPGRVGWLELSMREDSAPAPAAAACIARWQAAGFDLCSAVLRGPAFWQTAEIEEAPALVAASVDLLAQSVDA